MAGDGNQAEASVRRIGFWFDFASTYAYLSVARIEALAGARDVTIDWMPFLLGPIFAAQGWGDSPFNLYPAKGRYMWRDLQRRCDARQLPLVRPRQFPRNGLLAARVAIAAATTADGSPCAAPHWLAEYVRRVFHANFALDHDIALPAVVGGILASLNQLPEPLLARAADPEVKQRLRARTAEAEQAGIFGAPSFLVGSELFWGDDRLEDALAWAESAHG